MADKMMRVAARGDDGAAKAIKADDLGQLKVRDRAPLTKLIPTFTTNIDLAPNSVTPVVGTTSNLPSGFLNVSEYTALKIVVAIDNPVEVPELIVDFHIGRASLFTSTTYKLSLNVINEIEIPIKTDLVRISIRNNYTRDRALLNMNVIGVRGSEPSRMYGKIKGAQEVTPISLEKDNNGEGVIRAVDAAPVAYDAGKDAKRVTGKVDAFITNPTKVETVWFLNAESKRDTTSIQTALVDVSRFRELTVIVRNSLNTEIKISPQIDSGEHVKWWNPTTSAWEASNVVLATIPGGDNNTYVLNEAFPEILNKGLNKLKFLITIPNTPTTGTLDVKVLGVPNV